MGNSVRYGSYDHHSFGEQSRTNLQLLIGFLEHKGLFDGNERADKWGGGSGMIRRRIKNLLAKVYRKIWLRIGKVIKKIDIYQKLLMMGGGA
ncbi:hypothetical protein BGK38_05430 [Corynebacterium diphtheriae]|nr:hypothetical protein BS112_05780 [Corynebacterium diphtheriae]OWN03746.1 hypothetical protein AY499_06775 [Corynebacterium diphtheriae bv. gravis]OWN78999.1 hypothetical protein AY520_10255 [Corynebacterium diphtheriae bv. mitis]ODS17219.1 hypothetical protein BGK38_05430 [Corynebacterium diphtheriae]OLN20044.1 hypothetical protein BUE67_05925 [Corynebacterium diphtheriae]